MKYYKVIFCIWLAYFTHPPLTAQKNQLYVSLLDCIEIATDSTLAAFRMKNVYMADYWAYRAYKVQKLPSVVMNLTPIQYNSNFIKRYDFDENIEVYRQQQSINYSAGLSVTQNLALTGGAFSLETDFNYLRNFGQNVYSQFSSVPIRLSYSQSLFGFNRFKWENKIEPLKYEKAKKQFLYSREEIAENTVTYFFNLAIAKAEYEMALENITSTDSLYKAGKERKRISSISEADLLTLQIDLINAENSYENASVQLERDLSAFRSFLNINNDVEIILKLPDINKPFYISEEKAIVFVRENNPITVDNRQRILESEQELDQIKKTLGFSINLSTSIGYNQAADSFFDSYRDPLRQEVIQITMTIPILDWGIRKGRVNMAMNNLNIVRLSALQSEKDMEQELITLVFEFNKQQGLIEKAIRALDMATTSYGINKQRFIIGKADANTVILSLNRKKEAQKNYLNIVGKYWKCYYGIRKLTLYDFEKDKSLSFLFEME